MINIKIGVAELLQLCTSDNSTKKDHSLAGLFEQLLQNGLDPSLEIPQMVQKLDAKSDHTISERSIELALDDPKYNELAGNELAYLLLGIDLRIPQESLENRLESEEVTEYLARSSELKNMTNDVIVGQTPIVLGTTEDTTEEQVQNRPQTLAFDSEKEQTFQGKQKVDFREINPKDFEGTIIKEPILDNVPLRDFHAKTGKSSNLNKSFIDTGKFQIEDLKLMHNSEPLSSGQELVSKNLPLGMPIGIQMDIPIKKQSLHVFNDVSRTLDSSLATSELDIHVSELLEKLEPQVEIFNTKLDSRIFKSLPSQIFPDENLPIDVEGTEETESEEHLQRYSPYLKTKPSVSSDTVISDLTQTKSENIQDINHYTSEQENGNVNPVETTVLGEISTDTLTQSITKTMPEVESVSSQTSAHQLEFKDEVVDQIVDRMAFRLDQEYQEVKIQLKPDYLGEVSIKVAIERGIVRAEFIAENQAVKEIIAASLPQLKANMEQVGIQLGDVNVNLGNGQDSNNSGERQQQFSNRVIKQAKAPKFIAEPSLSDGYSQINIRA